MNESVMLCCSCLAIISFTALSGVVTIASQIQNFKTSVNTVFQEMFQPGDHENICHSEN